MITKSINNNEGSTLAILLTTLAFITGFGYYTYQQHHASEKENARFKFKTEINLAANHINLMLSNPKNCLATFTLPTVTKIPSSIVYEYTEDPMTLVLTVNSRRYSTIAHGGAAGYGNTKFKFESYELISNTALAEDDTAEFLVTIKNNAFLSAEGEPESLLKKIKMFVEWDTTTTPSTMRSCRALSNTDDQIWERGTFARAYYGETVVDPLVTIPVQVGIGTDSPTVALEVNGNILAKGDAVANDFTYVSDSNLKTRISNLENPMQVINNLRGVHFDWIASNKHDFGFIAQELEVELPKIIQVSKGSGNLKVDYLKILPFLIETFKLQKQRIEVLKKNISLKVQEIKEVQEF